MKKVLFPMLMLVCLSAMEACSSDSEYSSTTSTRDCVITAATMGTLYRTMHTTTTDGLADSTYKVAVTGSLYPLSIDQVNSRVYNVDSLPEGTDVKHVVFSTFTTSGVAAIRSLATAEDTTFSSTDSTDCSVERLLTVYAYDGVSTRTYRLNINVHQEAADTFRWTKTLIGDATLKELEGVPHIERRSDGTLLVYGKRGETTVALTGQGDNTGWETTELPTGFEPTSVVRQRGADNFYALTDNGLAHSTDGLVWETIATDFRPETLLCVGTNHVIALKDATFFSSTDGGTTWTQDNADEPQNVPIASACRATVVPSRTDSQLEDFVVVGYTATGQRVVWRRTADLTGTEVFDWYYLPEMTGDYLVCPDFDEPSLMTYDSGTLLIGLDKDGLPAAPHFSQDNGRTWKDGMVKALDYTAATTHHLAATTCDEQLIWVVDTGTGELWHGRHNRLGWQTEQDTFERSRRR